MLNAVYIDGARATLDHLTKLGVGGEANVYIYNGSALKVYKTPDDPVFDIFPDDRKAAAERIKVHQTKLPSIPSNLPENVVAPQKMALDGKKMIAGYTMQLLNNTEPMLQYSKRKFHDNGLDVNIISEIFRDLYNSVVSLHSRNIVIGDFNDLNILVKCNKVYLIDVDSYQFDKYLCTTFVSKFLDPLLTDGKSMTLSKPFNSYSDWYAFVVMFMQSLLCIDPYGGKYVPKDLSKKVIHDDRPLKRITVFNSDVRYPDAAIPFSYLPDDLLHYFHEVFEKDRRGVFPEKLLDIHWQTCYNCGLVHARSVCPSCAKPGAVKQSIVMNGTVKSTTIFRTTGKILFGAIHDNNIKILYHEDGKFWRERGINDNKPILEGNLDPTIRYRIAPSDTLIGNGNKMYSFPDNPLLLSVQVSTYVGSFGNISCFDTNSKSKYWISNGQIVKEGDYGQPMALTNVVDGQTMFWIGEELGFGITPNLNVYFVFYADKPGNIHVKIPRLNHQLIDSTCVFGKNLIWFFMSYKDKTKVVNRCYAIDKDGNIVGMSEANDGDDSWLGEIRGKCAVGRFLFAGTDEGMVRLEVDGSGGILEAVKFPDTKGFINQNVNLFAAREGIYVVSSKDVKLIEMRGSV